MIRPIATLEEFYAHAIAIEREAAERYREFEAWYGDRGEAELARLCSELARAEEAHGRLLAEASAALSLPAIVPGEHLWLESTSPEEPARALFYRVVNPRQLLEIALQAEIRARKFFERASLDAKGEVRAAAQGMALEEAEHEAWVRTALARLPARIDWSRSPVPPGTFLGTEEEF